MAGVKAAIGFFLDKKDSFQRVLVTNSSDSIVLEAVNHGIVFPDEMSRLDRLELLKLRLEIESSLDDYDE